MAHESHTDTDGNWFGGRRLRLAGLVAAPILVVVLLAYWLGVPRLADAIVRAKLESVEQRAEVTADFRRIETSAFEGVTLHDVTVRRNGADDPFVTVGRVRAQLNLYHLLWGDPVVGSLDVEEASATIHRHADGTTNIERVLANLRGGDRPTGDASGGDDAGPPSFLRYFGGEWPHAEITDAELTLTAAPEASEWPVSRLATPTFEVVSSGMTARITTTLALESGPGADPRWSIPTDIAVDGTLRLPLDESTGTVDFENPLEVVGFEPYPFVRVGLGAVAVEQGRTLEVRGASLGLQTDGDPSSVGAADRVALTFDHWPTGPADVSLAEVVVEKPKVATVIDRQHGSSVHDVLQLLRAPRADHVRARARHVARMHYLDIPRWNRPKLENDDNGDTPGLSERLQSFVTDRLLAEAVPEVVEVRKAEVHLTDHRRMGLADPAERVGLRNGKLVLRHDPTDGGVTVEAGFDAYAGESETRGSLTATLEGNASEGTLEVDAELDELDLSWASQMIGLRLARTVKGGRLAGHLATSRDSASGRHTFKGFLRVENGMVHAEKIAEDPIADVDAGYDFEGYYDPNAEMPELKYVERHKLDADEKTREEIANDKRETDAGASADDSADAGTDDAIGGLPTTGAFVLTSGEVGLNGVTADFEPAVYGIRGLDHMPTRFDMSFHLEQTDVQALFEAVPEAIRGPTVGTKMRGQFGWDLEVEVPLHNADEMDWKTRPKLVNFELEELPTAVDVRRLEEGFTHHIHDETIEFARTVPIPPMRPVPATWLVEHGEMTLEEIDERRRERGWPPLPSESELSASTPPSTLQTPNVWTTDAAERMVAPKPWQPNQPLATVDRDAVPSGRDPVDWARDQIRETNWSPPPFGTDDEPFMPPGSMAGPSADLRTEPATSAEQPSSSDESANPDDSSAGRWIGRDPSEPSSDPSRNTTSRETDASENRRPDADPVNPSALVQKKGRTRIHPYGNYVYVPLHHMSKWLPRVVMTTEDNSFFEHLGFNWYAFQESVEDNLEAGAFVRGASTVSMQLVKNVFLSFDKVVARKIREAFLVWLMEDVVDVPKARIMELYFNIIEFGPGIFGIHDASVHYFGKRPDDLTLSEALWLVGIVPNPKEYHDRYYERGKITDAWYETLITFAEIMRERDRATDKDVEFVREHKPTFYKPAPGEPKLRPGERSKKPSIKDFTEIFQ